LNKILEELTAAIKSSYEEGVTVAEAERLAGKFLYTQLLVVEELRKTDLDSRVRKSGVKAVKAAVYLEGARSQDKKPSDALLNAQVDVHELVQGEQESFDKSESYRDYLENQLNILKDGHIHFRTIAKGNFNG
jgi:hypothetical protein